MGLILPQRRRPAFCLAPEIAIHLRLFGLSMEIGPFFAQRHTGPVSGVRVTERARQAVQPEIARLSEADVLREFEAHWLGRVKMPAADGKQVRFDEFPYGLHIERGSHVGAWLYRPDGFITLLAMAHVPLYKLSDPARFNRFIGIQGP